MKVLAIADRPPKENIETILSKNSIELICTLGDLDQHSLDGLEFVTNIPKIGVYGNHDSGLYFEPLGIGNMHLKIFTYGGLVFGGFEGCVRYKESSTAKMYTQEEATALFKDFPYVDVLLTHCPPYGVNDEPNELAHQGFQVLRDYVEQKKPKYLLHGHTYPTAENIVTKLGDTQIIYIYQDKIIDLQ
jgi:Icc-related predicted phosphoesterase